MITQKKHAQHGELFRARQYGQGFWRVYKHTPGTGPQQLGTIKQVSNPIIVSWSVSGSDPYVFTVTGATFSDGDVVILRTGNPPAGISLNTPYIVVNAS